jgi:hypothetical protein
MYARLVLSFNEEVFVLYKEPPVPRCDGVTSLPHLDWEERMGTCRYNQINGEWM